MELKPTPNDLDMLIHDIRTPLAATAYRLELLLQSSITEAQRHHLMAAQQSLQQAQTVIECSQDRDGDKPDKTTFTTLGVRQFLQTIIENCAHHLQRPPQSLNLIVRPSVPMNIISDGGSLSIILTELIENAHKYGEGKFIDIIVDHSAPYISVKVINEGSSIDSEDLPFIFQNGYRGQGTDDAHGQGIGLAGTRYHARRLDGHITHDRKADKTVFTLKMPVVETPIKGFGEEPTLKSMIKDMSILIVDDDHQIRDSMATNFTMQDAKVQTAENGREALHKITQNRFDLALLDYFLPDINGIELLQAIEADTKPEHIIFLSGNIDQRIKDFALLNGADDFIEKTGRIKPIKQAIQALLASPK